MQILHSLRHNLLYIRQEINNIMTFADIGDWVTQSTSLFSNTTIISIYMLEIKPIALAVLAMFISWRGIEIALGRNTKPISDTLIELIVWSIVWSMAFNLGNWLQEIQQMMNNVYEGVGGGKGFFVKLDDWSNELAKISSVISKKDSTPIVQIKALLTTFIIGLATIIIVIPSLVIITTSYFIVQILIAIAPFMILSYIFPSIRQLYDNWIRLFLTNVLILLLISIFQNALLDKIKSYLAQVLNDANTNVITDSSMIASSISIFIMAVFFSTLISICVPLAKALTGSFQTLTRSKGKI